MGRPRMTQARMQARCDRFNADHPVGSDVMFFNGLVGEDGQIGAIKAPAHILSGHTPVVWIEGARGCIALSHVRPVPRRAA